MPVLLYFIQTSYLFQPTRFLVLEILFLFVCMCCPLKYNSSFIQIWIIKLSLKLDFEKLFFLIHYRLEFSFSKIDFQHLKEEFSTNTGFQMVRVLIHNCLLELMLFYHKFQRVFHEKRWHLLEHYLVCNQYFCMNLWKNCAFRKKTDFF